MSFSLQEEKKKEEGKRNTRLTKIPTEIVAEAAVVGVTDDLTGQAVNAFVSLKNPSPDPEQTRKDCAHQVRKSIGPFAAPKAVYIVEDLPKTRSGKIMRRILRKILSGEEDSLGDISTVSSYLCRCSFFLSSLPLSLFLTTLFFVERVYSNVFFVPSFAQLSDPSVVAKIIETYHASKK